MRSTIKIAVACIMLLASSMAQAQELNSTLTLELRDNEAYTMTMVNTGVPIESWELRLASANFDTVNNGPGFPTAPEVGSNNDGSRSSTMLFQQANGPFTGTVNINGDIDGGVEGVESVLTYENGQVRIIDHVQTQNNPIHWVATVGESVGPPPIGPVVDGQGEASLQWTAPTENEDGTPLNDLAGFVIYWDSVSRLTRCGDYPVGKLDGFCYGNALDVPDPGATTLDITIQVEADASMFFTASAYANRTDEDDNPITVMSAFSNEVEKRYEVIVTEPVVPPPSAPGSFDVTITFTCTTEAPATCEVKEIVP